MAEDTQPQFDSLLIVSFGGPEGPQDVLPFLENVLRGKNVPRERMLEVADHYARFQGVSPINEQNRQLIAALEAELRRRKIDLPVYWGNRNWHPLLAATLQEMRAAGKQRALAFFTSIFSSYSGCRQYRENIAAAQQEVGVAAPEVHKVRMGFNHPEYMAAQTDLLRQALAEFAEPRDVPVLFSAHSIPLAMAEHCRYVEQLHEAARLIAAEVGVRTWEVVYQSRSGPPSQPWLEPDIGDRVKQLAEAGDLPQLCVVPLGFISDHIEVLYDLDTEVAELCRELGIEMVRVPTVGVHPAFIRMIADLVEERLFNRPERPYVGTYGPSHDVCAADCCLYPRTRPVPS